MFFSRPYIALFGATVVVKAQGRVCDFLSATPTATIQSGVIVGTVTSIPGATIPVNKFLGIPFAAAPTGSARFSVPKPISNWSTPKDTKEFSPACIQVFSLLSRILSSIEAVFDPAQIHYQHVRSSKKCSTHQRQKKVKTASILTCLHQNQIGTLLNRIVQYYTGFTAAGSDSVMLDNHCMMDRTLPYSRM